MPGFDSTNIIYIYAHNGNIYFTSDINEANFKTITNNDGELKFNGDNNYTFDFTYLGYNHPLKFLNFKLNDDPISISDIFSRVTVL